MTETRPARRPPRPGFWHRWVYLRLPYHLLKLHYSKPHVLLALLCLMIGLILLGLAAIDWPGQVAVTGDLVAMSVSMRIDRGLDMEPGLPLDPKRPISLAEFTTITPGPSAPVPRSAVLQPAGDVELAALHVAPGGLLTLSMAQVGHRRAFRVLAGTGGGASLDLQAAGPAVLRAGEAKVPLGPDDPALVTVATDGRSQVPMRAALWLPGAAKPAAAQKDDDWAGQFVMEDVAVSGLRFGAESSAPDASAFVSSIRQGKLTLVGTGQAEDLQIGSPLAMTHFRGALVRLSVEPDGIHLFFSGLVHRLWLGPATFAQDLTPTMLDIAYNTQWVKLTGAAALALLGALLPGILTWFNDGTRA